MRERSDYGMILLDGRTLARHREPSLAQRAADVQARRGRAPALLIVAFADERGRVPYVSGKARACARVGVAAESVIVSPGATTRAVIERMAEAIDTASPDAVFLQIPAPPGFSEDELIAALPPALDVDIMTPARADAYLGGQEELPPVTVSGALALLDAHDLSLAGRRGIVVAEPSVYSRMIVEAFERRGAALQLPVPPQSAELEEQLRAADLVIAAAAAPGAVSSSWLQPGCIALDFGYFNDGARGDIDTSSGTAHLGALMPVPGGVGPMTVSALVERVIAFAGG